MCYHSILIEGLSPDEKDLLITKKGGRGFGTGSAPISVINGLMNKKLVQRTGYEDKYGRASWALTYCGRKAGYLLADIAENPLLRIPIEDEYNRNRINCPYLRSNPRDKKSNARRKEALKRARALELAEQESRWPYGPYPDPCEHCGGPIELKTCTYANCWAPGKHYHMWQTSPSRWNHLPRQYRKMILCKKCFKTLSGISPGPYWQG